MLIRRDIAFVSCFLGLSVAACGNLLDKLKGGVDAGTDAGAVVVSGSGIENEAAITRYLGEEVSVSGEAKTVRAAVVHSTFPGTDIVATIPADTSVIEMATHAGGVLIVFDQAATKKMGWVDATALPPIVAPADDAEDATAPTKVVVVNRDAGAKAVDAGKVVDAGKPVADASAPKADAAAPATKPDASAPATDTRIVKPVNASGKCDSGFVEFPVKGGSCRKQCTTDVSCGAAGAKCVEKGNEKKKLCYVTR